MGRYWLTNVLLETGRVVNKDIEETITDVFDIEITDGYISAIEKHNSQVIKANTIDAKGYLMVPTFKEMHNHLDKTYLSLKWKAVTNVDSLKERLYLESQELKELAPKTQQRAQAMIDLITSYGSTHIRTHVNIDPYIKLENLEGVMKALDNNKHRITYEVIAFPQHGLILHKEMKNLMKEALRNGATMVGGLDPGGIDGALEPSLDLTMDLATEFNAAIDIHLHDRGNLGFYTIDKLTELTEKSQFKGRVSVSHGFGLGNQPPAKVKSLAQRMSKMKMDLCSGVPFDGSMPIDLLWDNGVKVSFGCDGFYDSWSPLGTGNILKKTNYYCQLYGQSTETKLSQALKYITDGITPLNLSGEQMWPAVGDVASFNLFEAPCTAYVVARTPECKAIYFNGKELTK